MIPLPDKKYSIIYADPPWSYQNRGTRAAASKHYDTMTIEDIKRMGVGAAGGGIANEDCVLFMWATFPMLREALDVIEAWGFSYKTVAFNWVKQNRNGTGIFMGLGNWTRSNSEICLLATKGKPKRISGSVRSIVLSPLQQHSRKPAEIRDRIVSLKETKIFEINGQTYADASLTRIPPHVDRPDCISVSGLDSICKLIRTELEKVGTTIMVQVKSNDTVEVMTTYLSDFSRNTLYRAKADAPGLRTGFRGREVALIELRSLCIPNEGTAYLLDLLSRMTNENSVSTNDNGVTQTVEARQGVALNAVVEIKPRVMLRPFRTFLEVEQPESEFLLRVDPDEGIGFFEADGGIWKLEAKKNIADYFLKNMGDLIDAGKVVVMQ